MFFYPAKILWFLLQPSSLVLAALIGGAILAFTSWRCLARRLLWGATIALLVFGLSPLRDVLVQPLEWRFPRAEIERAGIPISGIIVLGGAEDSRSADSPELASVNEAAERYIEAVALARRLPGARLVFSGGSASLVRNDPPESDMAARLFEALGVGKDRIMLESKSRDTYENAQFTARLLDPQPNQRWLLVTSASHMPRAMGCFRRAGFAVEPWPVDFRTPRRLDLTQVPNSLPEGLRRIDQAAREYVGLLAYYLAGRTDALFPAP